MSKKKNAFRFYTGKKGENKKKWFKSTLISFFCLFVFLAFFFIPINSAHAVNRTYLVFSQIENAGPSGGYYVTTYTENSEYSLTYPPLKLIFWHDTDEFTFLQSELPYSRPSFPNFKSINETSWIVYNTTSHYQTSYTGYSRLSGIGNQQVSIGISNPYDSTSQYDSDFNENATDWGITGYFPIDNISAQINLWFRVMILNATDNSYLAFRFYTVDNNDSLKYEIRLTAFNDTFFQLDYYDRGGYDYTLGVFNMTTDYYLYASYEVGWYNMSLTYFDNNGTLHIQVGEFLGSIVSDVYRQYEMPLNEGGIGKIDFHKHWEGAYNASMVCIDAIQFRNFTNLVHDYGVGGLQVLNPGLDEDFNTKGNYTLCINATGDFGIVLNAGHYSGYPPTDHPYSLLSFNHYSGLIRINFYHLLPADYLETTFALIFFFTGICYFYDYYWERTNLTIDSEGIKVTGIPSSSYAYPNFVIANNGFSLSNFYQKYRTYTLSFSTSFSLHLCKIGMIVSTLPQDVTFNLIINNYYILSSKNYILDSIFFEDITITSLKLHILVNSPFLYSLIVGTFQIYFEFQSETGYIIEALSPLFGLVAYVYILPAVISKLGGREWFNLMLIPASFLAWIAGIVPFWFPVLSIFIFGPIVLKYFRGETEEEK